MDLSRITIINLLVLFSVAYTNNLFAIDCSSDDYDCVDAWTGDWVADRANNDNTYEDADDLIAAINDQYAAEYAGCSVPSTGVCDENTVSLGDSFSWGGTGSPIKFTAEEFINYSVNRIRKSHFYVGGVFQYFTETNVSDHPINGGPRCPTSHPNVNYLNSTPGLINCYNWYEYWLISSIKKSHSPASMCEGNPCNPSTGAKVQTETDYISSSDITLNVNRTYNSQTPPIGDDQPANWQNSFSSKAGKNSQKSTVAGPYNTRPNACNQGFNSIKGSAWKGALEKASPVYINNNTSGSSCTIVSPDQETITTFTIIKKLKGSGPPSPSLGSTSDYYEITMPDGSFYTFSEENGVWVNSDNPNIQFEIDTNGNWIYTDKNGNKSTYSPQGQLIKQTLFDGKEVLYAYDLSINNGGDGNPDTLDQVTGASGRSLYFHYTVTGGVPLLTSITTPDGDIYYSYDDDNNQSGVTYPDNTSKTYHYEDANYPNHLTGITDEKGNRFATWSYDANGKTTSSEHGVDVEKVTLSYNSNGTTTVNGVLGDVRTYHFTLERSNRVVTSITGDECSTCGNGFMKTRTYDANGYLNGYTDWKGI